MVVVAAASSTPSTSSTPHPPTTGTLPFPNSALTFVPSGSITSFPRSLFRSVYETDGAKVLVDDVSLEFLQGATVDYAQELIRSSFTVSENPNTEAHCGCGSSFMAK
jgi:hypothetical protein